MRKLTLVTILAVFFYLLPVSCNLSSLPLAYAEIPHLINFQGRLVDKDGKLLGQDRPVIKSITLTIFDAIEGGQQLWQEIQNVTVQKGIFSVLIGSVNAAGFKSLSFDKPYYLEIKVETDEPMKPRQLITAAGCAIMAENTLSLPKGVIVMWYGKISEIPSGWVLCDGKSEGIPDLRDRFIVGAMKDDNNEASTTITGSPSKKGGTIKHTHSVSISGTTSANNYTGSVQSGQEGHFTFANDGHSHSFSANTATAESDNLPLYYALAFIIKT